MNEHIKSIDNLDIPVFSVCGAVPADEGNVLRVGGFRLPPAKEKRTRLCCLCLFTNVCLRAVPFFQSSDKKVIDKFTRVNDMTYGERLLTVRSCFLSLTACRDLG